MFGLNIQREEYKTVLVLYTTRERTSDLNHCSCLSLHVNFIFFKNEISRASTIFMFVSVFCFDTFSPTGKS